MTSLVLRRECFAGQRFRFFGRFYLCILHIRPGEVWLCKMAGRDPDMLGRRNGEVFAVNERAVGATYWKVN